MEKKYNYFSTIEPTPKIPDHLIALGFAIPKIEIQSWFAASELENNPNFFNGNNNNGSN